MAETENFSKRIKRMKLGDRLIFAEADRKRIAPLVSYYKKHRTYKIKEPAPARNFKITKLNDGLCELLRIS
jgi:hypothetical protein